MMIDPRHLKLVVAIEKVGSLSKAARELNLTQSALSHQLRKLEDHLGLKVFSRTGNQLYFTEAGREFLDQAQSILGAFDQLESRMNDIRENQLERYIHGYSNREARRLADQASTVGDFLHVDTFWEPGSTVLEVGCGVGAQTEIIASQNPNVSFQSIDISEASLAKARARIAERGIQNAFFQQRDARELNPRVDGKFDHIFICFLLEHLRHPVDLLLKLKSVLQPGGTITVIEGDHGSTFFYPANGYAKKVVKAQVELQQRRGGNANIGRELHPLLQQAGFHDIEVNPRQIYVDASRPSLVDGFIRNTFTAMIQGLSEDLLQEKLVTAAELAEGIKGLLRTTEPDGVFSYTFFKGRGKCI